MLRRIRLVVIGMATAGLLVLTVPARAQAVVQRVDLEVVVEDPVPHPVVRERLVATVQSVVDRLLVGRSLDQLTPATPQLGETIASVVDRVATGYAVAGTAIQIAAVTTVRVHLRPLGTVIAGTEVLPDLRVVHARVQPLARELLQTAAPRISALYTGLPVAAMPWAEPLLEASARGAVEDGLAGFTAAIRVRVQDDRARAEVALLPRDSRVVRNIGVRFRSTSIPTMLLDPHGPAVASMADPLRGLPVAFAQAHRAALARLITDDLAAYPPARQYRIIATAVLDVGETTFITVVADSVLYRARVQAELNIGTRAPGPAVAGHLGRVLTPGTELYIDIRLVPNTLSLEWQFGAQTAITPSVTVGAAYALVAQETTVWAALQVGLDTGLRGTWALSTQTFEGALTYRFNEFLAGELVGTSRGDWWLRLISNL